jgi:hypothetical protein
MRSDFYGRLETLPALAQLADLQTACYSLLPPDAAELGQIIRRPVREAGLHKQIVPGDTTGISPRVAGVKTKNTFAPSAAPRRARR